MNAVYIASGNKRCNINAVKNSPSRPSPPSSRLSAAALSAFENAEKLDWEKGVPLAELLERVNRVADVLLPGEGDRDREVRGVGRVQRMFTPRGFRHYQTLRAIDAPEKHGRFAAYGYRHFVQALLVRRLLWERVPAEQVVAMVAGRTTEETRGMFLEGIEIVAQSLGRSGKETGTPEQGRVEVWRRIPVAPGIELSLRDDLPRYRPRDVERLLAALEAVLRRQAR
jgi:hypothetical protein